MLDRKNQRDLPGVIISRVYQQKAMAVVTTAVSPAIDYSELVSTGVLSDNDPIPPSEIPIGRIIKGESVGVLGLIPHWESNVQAVTVKVFCRTGNPVVPWVLISSQTLDGSDADTEVIVSGIGGRDFYVAVSTGVDGTHQFQALIGVA